MQMSEAVSTATERTMQQTAGQQSANAYMDTGQGVWFVVDAPSLDAPLRVEDGVLSIRGWAWSRAWGPGVVQVEVTGAGGTTVYECPHRYCRFDISAQVQGIPLDNYAGFEVSLDRYDLPPQGTVFVTCTFSGVSVRLGGVSFTANHAGRLQELEEIGCDCCGGVDLTLMGKKGGLTIRQCRNCGLAFTSPRPRFETIRQRYSAAYFRDEYLPEMHRDGLFEERRRHWNNILDHLERFKPISPRLFEVGCGAGYLLQEAKARGWDAAGLDLNPSAIAYSRSHGLTADVGDISTYVFPEHKVGAFVLESVLEHLLSPRSVLQKCASTLHPGGGMFILTLGYQGDLFMTQGMAFQYVGPSEHLFYFSVSSLCRLCECVGLRVEHLWHDVTNDTIMLLATRRLD